MKIITTILSMFFFMSAMQIDAQEVSNLVVFVSSNKFGLIDSSKNIVVKPYYDYIGQTVDNYFITSLNSKLGIISPSGIILSEPKYISIGDFYDDRALVVVDGQNALTHRYGYIDKSGAEVIKPIYSFTHEFSEGLSAVFAGDELDFIFTPNMCPSPGAKVGFINTAGKIVIQLQYSNVTPFINGRSVVTVCKEGCDCKYGLIDTKGNLVINLNEARIRQLGSYVFSLGNTNQLNIFNLNGDIISSSKSGYIYEGELSYIKVKDEYITYQNEKMLWGVLDSFGKEIIPFQYNAIDFINSKCIAVHSNAKLSEGYDDYWGAQYWFWEGGEWSLISLVGKQHSSEMYEEIKLLSDCLIALKKDNKWSVSDNQGNILSSNTYDEITVFSEGMGQVQLNNKWGFIDSKGVLAIQPIYEDVSFFSEGLAAVSINGKWGFIDKTGNEVIPMKYDQVEDFSNGFSLVNEYSNRCYIDKSGLELCH